MAKKVRTIEMQRLTVEEFREAAKLPLVVVLDDVRSMHNPLSSPFAPLSSKKTFISIPFHSSGLTAATASPLRLSSPCDE